MFDPGFNAMGVIFSYVYNLTRAFPDLSTITPDDLAPVCTAQNQIIATAVAKNDSSTPYTQLFMSFATLDQVYEVFVWGVENYFDPQPAGSNFTTAYWENNGPGAVRLALVPGGMTVSWQTLANYTNGPAINYGLSSDALTSTATGTTHLWAGVSIHDVVLQNLQPNTKYYYSVAGDSTVLSFKTALAPGATDPFEVLFVGDMGIMNAGDTYNRLVQSLDETDLIIHIGDLTYADDYFLRPGFAQYDTFEETWSQWQSWLSPVTSAVPYMTLPGNHEATCQLFLPGVLCPTTTQNFVSYRNRVRMPSVESGAGDVQSMWSSFDYGLVHFVLINTETDFTGATEFVSTNPSKYPYGPFGGVNGIPTQLAWLEADLKKANDNRQNVPWIVVAGHRPVYTGKVGASATDTYNLFVKQAFEPLFNKYSVDAYLAGHMHMYERLYPIANDVPQHYDGNVYLNPTATTYIVNGAAGNDERHEPVLAGFNTTITAVTDDDNYGYGKIFATNATHMRIQFIRASDNSVGDDIWLVQTGRDPSCLQSTSVSQQLQGASPDRSYWSVQVTITEPVYSLQLTIGEPDSVLSNAYGLSQVGPGVYEPENWYLQSGYAIPAGTVLQGMGFSIAGSTPLNIRVSEATCTPPPKNCTFVPNLQQVGQWNTGSANAVQYLISGQNIGQAQISSFDFKIHLSEASSTITNTFNLDNLSPVSAQAFTAESPLWGLAPGSNGGASGFTVVTPNPVVGTASLEVLGYNCQYHP